MTTRAKGSTVFDVYLNDRQLCRAGVGADGVLTTTVSWVKLTGAVAATARSHGAPVEEARLDVGGLRREAHRSWLQRELVSGDRVTVALGRARRWDAPAHEQPRQARAAIRSREPQTRFLNVDLDIYAAQPLDALVAAFGSSVVVLHCGREGRRHSAHLELAATSPDPERALRRFVGRVEGLPPAAKRLWTRASAREFNVGIQAAAQPHRVEWSLAPATLLAIARVGARLGTTVYGAAGE